MERRRNRPEKYDRELVHKTGECRWGKGWVRAEWRQLGSPAPTRQPSALLRLPHGAGDCPAPGARVPPPPGPKPPACVGCDPRPPPPAVKAIKKVDAIRSARQDRFYEARMSKAKKQQAAAERRQLEQEIHLVKAPGALAKEKEEKLKGGWAGCGAGRAGGGAGAMGPGRRVGWLRGAGRGEGGAVALRVGPMLRVCSCSPLTCRLALRWAHAAVAVEEAQEDMQE